jgi:hypothetical protein
MQCDLVEGDDPGARAKGLDDPAVRARVVADVVERYVGVRGSLAAAADDVDLDPAAEGGQKERAMSRYARPLGR